MNIESLTELRWSLLSPIFDKRINTKWVEINEVIYKYPTFYSMFTALNIQEPIIVAYACLCRYSTEHRNYIVAQNVHNIYIPMH